MPTEVPRCSDCGAALKAVPSWLAGAKASFTCTSCPKRANRVAAAPRIDKPLEIKAVRDEDDADIDSVDIDEADEEADLEIGADDLDDAKDDVDI